MSTDALCAFQFDQVFWRAISGQINRWRKRTIGISSTNLDKLEPHKVPFLYNFSPTVVPPPLDWYEWIRITGAFRLLVARTRVPTLTRSLRKTCRLLVPRRPGRLGEQEVVPSRWADRVYGQGEGGWEEDCVHWVWLDR